MHLCSSVVLTNRKGSEYINKTANYHFSDSPDSLFMQLYLERQCRFGFSVFLLWGVGFFF